MTDTFRTDTGELRFLWKLATTLILTFTLVIISRLALVLTVQQVFILQGTPPSVASQDARAFFAETPEGLAIAGSLDFLLMFLLVIFLISKVEKKEIHWVDIGLKLKRSTISFILVGSVIGLALFLGSLALGIILGTQVLPIIPDLGQWSTSTGLIASVTFYSLNSFWQELVFRGYLQTRAIERYGKIPGIIFIAVVFVVFHGLVQTLTLPGIINGILLFCFIGLLYVATRSIYLVTAIHALLNFLPVLFVVSWAGVEAAIVYSVALALLVLVMHTLRKNQT